MHLGRTCCSTNTVTTSSTTNKHHHIATFRLLTHNHVGRSSRNNGPQLHALGLKARVIDFCHLTSSKTDLVSIGAKSSSSLTSKLHLGQLSCTSSFHRHRGICSTSYTERLVHPRATRKGISDGTTNTGSGSTKGLDFCRMIVGFILEHQKPAFSTWLWMGIFHIDINRTGVDFGRKLNVIKLAVFFQIFCSDNCHVHEGHWLITANYTTIGGVAVHFQPHVLVIFPGLLEPLGEGTFFDGNGFKHRVEGGVTAMV